MTNTISTLSIFNKLSFEPTTSQSKALFELEDFLVNPTDEKVFILSGSAGTGKTTLSKAVVNFIKQLDLPALLIAPTGKAASILKEKSGIETQTIHQLIYHPEQLEDGSVKFNFKDNNTETRTIYIVDEASMVSAQNESTGDFKSPQPLLLDLMKYVLMGNHQNQIIFLGDNYQLTPVFEIESVALSAGRISEIFKIKAKQVQLTEITRQANDSPILKLANQIKDARDKNLSLYSLKPQKLSNEALALDYYTTFFDNKKLDEVIMICKTNDQVQAWNHKIREELGFGHFSLCVGDTVMVRNTWMGNNQQVVNGEMGVITKLSAHTEEIAGLLFKDAEINFVNGSKDIKIETKIFLDSLNNPTAKIDAESVKNLKKDRMQKNPAFRLSQRSSDDAYMNAIRLSYGYAITGHKAQGSEWKRVLFTPEKLFPTDYAWMYTAVTRARNEVFSWWF